MSNDITVIRKSGLLSPDNVDTVKELSDSIEHGFEVRQRFRPRFLMETSVLNDMKHPTPDAKYWQSRVERDVHFRNLVMLSYDYREKQADMKILEYEIACDMLNPAQVEKREIQIERMDATLLYMRKEAAERVREIQNWSEIMEALEPELKYDPDDTEAHMPEAFAIRFAREKQMMKMTAGQADTDGAMNILSVGQTVANHESVKELI